MKKAKCSEQGSRERWLVSYADVVTLLFALFVILYAQSKNDVDRLKKVQQSMRDAFDGSISENPSSGASPLAAPKSAPTASTKAGLPSGAPDQTFSQARSELQESFRLETGVADVNDKVEISEDDRGLIVRLAAQDFFDDGVVEARADLRPLLDRIAKVLSGISNPIRVEGHSDIEEESSNPLLPVSMPSPLQAQQA